ncbi:MAG: acetyl-CoA carboxylase biotin carboxyl carrier protein [Chroococcales cyanobacterium]
MELSQICEILAAIAEHDIAELTLKSEGFELTVRKANPIVAAPSDVPMVAVAATPTVSQPQAVATPSMPSEPAAPPPVDSKLVDITSPMVGTFYRAPAPDEAPFVEVSDRIQKNQTVCIIEAMKLMNEIEAEVSGQVIEILVENGEPVEYGQPLMRIKPD